MKITVVDGNEVYTIELPDGSTVQDVLNKWPNRNVKLEPNALLIRLNGTTVGPQGRDRTLRDGDQLTGTPRNIGGADTSAPTV